MSNKPRNRNPRFMFASDARVFRAFEMMRINRSNLNVRARFRARLFIPLRHPSYRIPINMKWLNKWPW